MKYGIQISTTNGIPLYEQIASQVEHLVAVGKWKPGQEVPSIRDLADDVEVNAHTVARAYRELARRGVLTKRSTSGTYVSPDANSLQAQHQRLQRLAKMIDDLLGEARQLNVGTEEVIRLLRQHDEAAQPRVKET